MENLKEEYIQYRIKRAEESLNDSKKLMESESWNAAMNRLYYSCFYAVIALLYKYDIDAKSHKGVKNQFGQYFIKPGKVSKEFGQMYSNLFDLRQKGDYGDLFDFDAEKVKPFVPQVEQFIAVISLIIKQEIE